MSKTMKIAGATFATIVIAATAASGAGRFVSARRWAREVNELFEASTGGPPAVVAEADIAGLPEPVQRWLRYAQVIGNEYPNTVRLKMEGEFRLAEGQGWMPLEAEEYYTTDPPAFVWIVRMKMAPLLTITGRDRYVDGTGDIDMRVLSLLPVARKSGGNLNQGAMLRYLNETMWFPAGVLSPFITWAAIDTNSAQATMNYGGISASGTFHVDPQGRLVNMTAQRHNDAKGQVLPWSTPINAFDEFHGIRVSAGGEGIWEYETGDFSYIRVRVTEIDYNHPAQY